jgi:DNA polymerase III subunit alpha
MINLDTHSIYSTRRSLIKIEDLIKRIKDLDQSSVALTDDNGLYGVVKFFGICKSNNVKPLIGCQVQVCENIATKDKFNYELILLVKNSDGYKHLCKLITKSYTDGFWYIPRVDFKMLEDHSEGLIALASGLRNPISEPYFSGSNGLLLANDQILSSIFGTDWYIAINPFVKNDYKSYAQYIVNIAPMNYCVTNSSRFLKPDDYEFYDLLRCMERNQLYDNPKRIKSNEDEWLHSEQEIEQIDLGLSEDQVQFGLEATQGISDSIDFEFQKKFFFPKFFNDDRNIDKAFKDELNRCWKKRKHLLTAKSEKEYKDRVKFETEAIVRLGFSEYMLIASDIACFCKSNNIPFGVGRGSSGSSLVSFLLKITEVDPLRYDLLFERFLDPSGSRVTLPDIDMDVCTKRRSEVIDYIKQKYGEDKVAVVGNLSTLAFKSAIKDVARAFNISFENANQYTKLIPNKVTCFQEAKGYGHVRTEIKNNPEFERLLWYADGVKGSMKNLGTHAAGVVIAPSSITDHLPLQIIERNKIPQLVSQYDKDAVEGIGLVKQDLLGLTALTTVAEAFDLIKQRHNQIFNIYEMDLEAPETFMDMQLGNTVGMFQIESPKAKELARLIKPSSIQEVADLIAIDRPAVLESKMDEIYIENKFSEIKVPIHPQLEEITSKTNGILIYQEQMMQAAKKLASFSLVEADTLRRACAKKTTKDIPILKQKFIEGCRANNIPDKDSLEVFGIFENAAYLFPLPHSVEYSYLTCQTAWLKQCYPLEFLTAYINAECEDPIKLNMIINECVRKNIKVLPPSLNSQYEFVIDGDAMRFGLKPIKGLGEGFARAFTDSVAKLRPLATFHEILKVLQDDGVLTGSQTKMELLISCGVFDLVDNNRTKLVETFRCFVNLNKKLMKRTSSTLFDVFDLVDESPEDLDIRTKRSNEFQLMGWSFSC